MVSAVEYRAQGRRRRVAAGHGGLSRLDSAWRTRSR